MSVANKNWISALNAMLNGSVVTSSMNVIGGSCVPFYSQMPFTLRGKLKIFCEGVSLCMSAHDAARPATVMAT